MIANFKETITDLDPKLLSFDRLETLQVNLGNICNQQCEHCHVDASPAGSEIMSKEVIEKIIDFLRDH